MMLILVFSIQNVKRTSDEEEDQVQAVTAMFGDLSKKSKYYFNESHNVGKAV